jgi:hypothetical protein
MIEPKSISYPDLPVDTIILLNPRYKMQASVSDPMVLEQVLDMEATARVSVVIRNVGRKSEERHDR